MAWARRTGATLTGTFNSDSPWNAGNVGAAVTANDRIIAVIGLSEVNTGSQPTVTGITDSAGNTWNRDFLRQKTYSGYFAGIEIWSTVANGANAGVVNNVTIAFNHTLFEVGGSALALGVYSGIDTSVGAAAAVDISVGNDGTNTSSPADSGTTSGTTAAANELKIGGYVDPGNQVTISAGSLDTTYNTFASTFSTNTESAVLEDADSGNAGSTARATATWASGTQDWQMAVMVYKLSGGAPPPPTDGLLRPEFRTARRPAPWRPGIAR